jgi:hypothetical protein
LDFHGHYSFIGLSRVRETAIFSGIPIVEEAVETGPELDFSYLLPGFAVAELPPTLCSG